MFGGVGLKKAWVGACVVHSPKGILRICVLIDGSWAINTDTYFLWINFSPTKQRCDSLRDILPGMFATQIMKRENRRLEH